MVVVDMHESSDQINLQTLKQYPARQPTNETRKTDMHRLDIEYLKSGNLYTCKTPTIDIAKLIRQIWRLTKLLRSQRVESIVFELRIKDLGRLIDNVIVEIER